MAFNPMKLIELKNLRDRFAQNHPKFVKFMGDLASSTIECKSNDFRKPYDSYLYSHRTPSETWKENRVITEVC